MDSNERLTDSRKTFLPGFLIGAYFALTVVNYSFGQYGLTGTLRSNPSLPLILGVRTLIPFVVVLYYFIRHPRLTQMVMQKNGDILLLGILWILTGVVNGEITGSALYGLWGTGCLLMCLLFTCIEAFNIEKPSEFQHRFLKPVLWGNIPVALLIAGSVRFSPFKDGQFQPIYTSNSFWAYPFLILSICVLIRMRFGAASLIKKLPWFLIYLSALVCIYLSARRAPLITCCICGMLSMFPIRTFGFVLLLFLTGFLVYLLSDIPLKMMYDYLPDSYAKYRLERMAGLNRKFRESSVSDRQAIWRHYLEAFSDRPVMGHGLGLSLRQGNEDFSRASGFSPHNTFIGALAETGIAGTLPLLYIVFKSLFQVLLRHNPVFTRIYLLLFLPTVAINWVEYNLMPGQIFFLYSVFVWILPRSISWLPAGKGSQSRPLA